MNLVIADSKMKAGDNGEYFYEYVMKNHPNVKLYFIISKTCSDFTRLKKKGFNVIDIADNRIPEIFEKATYILFSKCQEPMSSLLCKKYEDKRIFLQHGVISGNSSIGNYFKKMRIKYICCSSLEERAIIKKACVGTKTTPIITGLPRWDSLISKNNNRTPHQKPHILITFHWRNGELHKFSHLFKASDYLKNINELLNSNELKSLSEKCEITFMHHATIEKYKSYFNVPSYINNGSNMQFQDMLVDADALITDFSSNAFEMSVINKPTFYYIPDKKYVIDKMKNYNINYLKNNCIGKYCDNLKELFETLNMFISGDFKLSENSLSNIFKYVGNPTQNNCKRLFDLLLKDINNNKKSTEIVERTKVVHGNGVWTRKMRVRRQLEEGNMVKVGNKYIYI